MQSLRNLPADTLASLRFLSRLPVPYSENTPLPDFQKQAHTFPLAGIIIAAPATILASISIWLGLQPLVVAIIAIATTIIITGALHEDGLADVADGFWGGHTIARKLEIMRDSSIGTYGTLALILCLSLTAALMAQTLSAMSSTQFAISLITSASLSRAAMLWPWVSIDNARPTSSQNKSQRKDEAGLSARFGMPDHGTMRATFVISLAPALLLAATFGIQTTLIVLIAASLGTLAMTKLAHHHIGGHTGDILGATQQIAHLGFWIALAATTQAP
ncbi:adenosylcobinamide-GDP ribazoletransferase [Ahrensia sp. R2A130]|uniref:adenosylcobinamide-GDP ribazoletransferase n=1 Tax=Ahrensia sp. R2A130 TaxID=744979 RepID=UPI0001E0F081|nr:adenosylcobinamide-GDP ribazoletransferase [Ahrensia sp. R2A130]EFL90443.1 cobalamin-5-phosphate synthase [Ahrensia sp. R2A130]